MKNREIAILAYKVLGFYAFVEAISKSYDVVYYLLGDIPNNISANAVLLILLPPILLILCGVLLWYSAPLLADNIFKSTIQEMKTEISSADTAVIAFSVVGLFLLANSLPRIVELIFMYYDVVVAQVTENRSPLISNIIVTLLKSILGLWFLFDSRRIAKFVFRKNEFLK